MADEADGAATTTAEEEIETLPEGIDDPMILKAEIVKKDKAIRQIHARAIKAETLLKERAPKNDEPIIQSSSPTQSQLDERVDLRLDGYNKEETEWIMQNGGRKSIEDTNSYVAIALNAKREQRQAEEAANGVSSTVGLSEIERKYTPEQLRNMSVKELEAILPHNS